ncbi:1-phosphatidylinositol-4-phosphate 5-kinase [Sporobolomyces koalae]|uniref:1-phosphatidylinositol-4-phosphate 5-kinase n=1 Tax=Sporobolomyces koalae TaxID=500713 RepID=UPI00316D442F
MPGSATLTDERASPTSSEHSSPDSSDNATTVSSRSTTTMHDDDDDGVNPLYSHLHPRDHKSQLVVREHLDHLVPLHPAQKHELQLATPNEGPSGALLEDSVGGGDEPPRSMSTMTLTPNGYARTNHDDDNEDDDNNKDEQDEARPTRVTHDRKDHLKAKLHGLKLEAQDKLVHHGLREPPSDPDPEPVDPRVEHMLDQPLASIARHDHDPDSSGDETETESERMPRLGRVDTHDSSATTYTTGDASFYSAESHLARSTVESLQSTRTASPVSFAVDGSSPPRLTSPTKPVVDRSPVAYAPGYVQTNSRLVPVPVSPSGTNSSSPKLSSSPRLSIPLPYVSSSSTASPRLVPTASVVKPSTSHPSLTLASQQQSLAPAITNGRVPARRASTTSPSLHPPVNGAPSSSGSRRGSSASTLLRPPASLANFAPPNQQPSPAQAVKTSSFPQRSLSTSSQLSPVPNNTLGSSPQHSLSYPPPLPRSPSSLSRTLSLGPTPPSIHDDVESSIALQAEQIRRQRFEKRVEQERLAAAIAATGTNDSITKGRAKEEDVGLGLNPTSMSLSLSSPSSPPPITTTTNKSVANKRMSVASSTRPRSDSRSSAAVALYESIPGGGGGLSPSASSSSTIQALAGGGSSNTRTSSALLSTTSLVSNGPSTNSNLLPVPVPPPGGSQHERRGSVASSYVARDRDSLLVGASMGGRRSVSTGNGVEERSTAAMHSSSPASRQGPSSLLQRSRSHLNPIAHDKSEHLELLGGGNDEKEKSAIPLVGNLIGTDHENYVLMYNMLTGIRIGVSRCQAKAARPLTDADYTARHKFSFDIVGNELTPSVRYDFKFKDYAPWVFRELREYFFLDPSDYLISLTAKYILSELGSPGKSGSFFYFSRDYRFIIKTIRHAEHKFLRKILKEYHEHVKKNPHTLLSRFYGLHRVKLPHGRKIHFVIMNNLFPPHRDIHETYDLKGSSVGRLYPEAKAAQNPHAVLKDLNWILRNRQLELGPEKKALFEEQLRRDTELMQKLGIMDYSLLTGVHMAEKGNEDRLREGKLSVFQPDAPKPTRKPTQIHRSADASALRAAVQRSDPQSITAGQDLPEHDTSTERRRFLFYQDEGGMRATGDSNENLDVIYFLGIIDILTPYTFVKRLEHFFKGIKNDKQCISAIPPRQYGDRFLNFIRSCIRGNPESLRPKMWMPPIVEEDENGFTRSEGGGQEREKSEMDRGKDKVQ